MGVRPDRLFTALAAALFLSACKGAPAPAGGPPGGFAPPPPDVTVVTISSASVPLMYEFPAQVVPYRRVEVRPRVEGIIQERPFTEGATVKQGQVLYRLESAKYEAALNAAKSRVDAAKSRVDRYLPLLAKHAIAQQDVDVAKSDLEAAQAALTLAKRDFDDTFVRAEMEGRVGRTLLEVGARVSGPGDLLTTIDKLDPVYVSFRPSSEQLLDWAQDPSARSLVRAGSSLQVQVLLSDGSLLPRTGRLDFVAPSQDVGTGTQEYRALFSNGDGVLVPGQFVRVRLAGFRAPNAIAVPVRAVQTAMGRQFVFVVGPGDTVQMRDIKTGQWSGDHWIIQSGLEAGDRVVVDGIQKVAPGRVAHPVPAGDAGSTKTAGRGAPAR